MSNFQWIILLLIGNIYFVGTRAKGPHTLAGIMPSKSPWTSGKHVQNSISMDLWKAHPNFKSIGPLGSTSKIPIHGPLGSTSKIQFHRTSRKHVQNSNKILGPLRSTSKIQFQWTSRKHVQILNPSEL